MEERYLVSFDDEQLTGLIEFVKRAVVNKDIAAIVINRIEDIDVDEYGNLSYILA